MTAGRAPNLKIEREMLSLGHLFVAGCDEVGRGSLGGPVSVGMVVVDATTKRPPTGLRDSKLLPPPVRESLVPRIESWSCSFAIGHSSAAEIDSIGILRALRLAGERALAALRVKPDVVLLDGNYDWFTRPERASASPVALSLPASKHSIRTHKAPSSRVLLSQPLLASQRSSIRHWADRPMP